MDNRCYVTDLCIKCKYTDCVAACPVDAFREGVNMLTIEPNVCIDCKACIPVCPAEAIYDDPVGNNITRPLPAELLEWKDLNERLSKGAPWSDRPSLR